MFLFEPTYRPAPVPLLGKDVYLRPPLLADYRAWSDLRGLSRAFLEPWEPLWGENALSRGTFRHRINRVVREWNGDLGYAFHIFATGRNGFAKDALLGLAANRLLKVKAREMSKGGWRYTYELMVDK